MKESVAHVMKKYECKEYLEDREDDEFESSKDEIANNSSEF